MSVQQSGRPAWSYREAGAWVVAVEDGPRGTGATPEQARAAAEQLCGGPALDLRPVPTATLSRSTEIAADPERVWELVSDLPAMGDYSPENVGGRWIGGATGPALDAVFEGANRRGWRRWPGRATVTVCEPGRAFAFTVSAPPPLSLPVSQWAYDLVPLDTGCRLTETWTLRVGRVMRLLGPLITGEPDRLGYTERSMEQTLARVKQRAERQTPLSLNT